MKDIISVIVPVYNVEKYLNKCIISIINQTYSNLEILLINDGSTDSCPYICDDHAIKDYRIKVIHKINGGLSSARNAGLDIAIGKYVTFVDSDDSLSLEYIEVLYTTLKKTNSQISVGNILIVQSDEESAKPIDSISNESIDVFSRDQAIMNMYEFNKNLSLQFVTVWANLYERVLFTNLRFPVGKINEDEYLNYKLFFQAKKISYNSKKIYFYLKRDGSIMNSKYSLINLSKLEALEERINYFKDKNYTKFLDLTRYLYFHNLLYHSFKIKYFFPQESEIYNSLRYKYFELCRELLNSKDLNIKKKLIVFIYFKIPKLYKFRI